MLDRFLRQFAPEFLGPTWRAWRAISHAMYGRPLDAWELELFRRLTGRTAPPSQPASEVWVVKGRRGGGTRWMALDVTVHATCGDYSAVLAPGERGTIMLVAADRRQARVLRRYIGGLLHGHPILERMIVNETREAIELNNAVVIEIHTASFRSTRGYTVLRVVCDEVAFWAVAEDSAERDVEVLNALRPAMATVPGAMLLVISSPYARRGALWETYQAHYGHDDDPVLVFQADSQTLNPSLPRSIIDRALAEDEAAASAEYLAQFRRDLETFIPREALEAVRVSGRLALPRMPGVRYQAFVDPSGGSGDAMTVAIVHAETEGRVVLDAVREVPSPFNPEAVVAEFAELLQAYGVGTVTGDRYAGRWPAERFRRHGITYEPSPLTKSELYVAALPLLMAGRVELLDHPRLFAQLAQLERRTARGGRDSIDHPPNGRDDLANAVCGALVLVGRPSRVPFGWTAAEHLADFF